MVIVPVAILTVVYVLFELGRWWLRPTARRLRQLRRLRRRS